MATASIPAKRPAGPPRRQRTDRNRRAPRDRAPARGHVATVQAVTHKAVPVTIAIHGRISDGIAEGFAVDSLQAHTADGPAGYLNLSYVPADLMARFFPDPFHWAVWRTNRYVWPQALLFAPVEDWPEDRLRGALDSSDLDVLGWSQACEASRQRRTMSHDDMLAQWPERLAVLNQRHAAEHARFGAWLLDRPVVDYSRVYRREHNAHIYTGGVRVNDTPTRDCQRQGVGQALYETAALWLHTRGLALHASGNQSAPAQGLWSKFEMMGAVRPVACDGVTRRVLDARRLLAARPQLQAVAEQLRSG